MGSSPRTPFFFLVFLLDLLFFLFFFVFFQPPTTLRILLPFFFEREDILFPWQRENNICACVKCKMFCFEVIFLFLFCFFYFPLSDPLLEFTENSSETTRDFFIFLFVLFSTPPLPSTDERTIRALYTLFQVLNKRSN